MDRTHQTQIAPWAMASALAERAALGAALVAPLYYVVFTDRIFEAEKAGVVRFLGALAWAALATAAYLGRRAATPGDAPALAGLPGSVRSHPVLRHPIARAGLAVWAACAAATALSVAPLASAMGSYDRGQGLLTDTALLGLGAAAVVVAARPGGTARLATFLGAAALPAGIYGMVQRAGLDPIPWLGDVVTRVSGPSGASPLYGAHLSMVLPFAAWRAAAAWRTALDAPSRAATAHLAAWLITVAAGAAGLVLSASRGPVLGLAAGCAAAGLAWCAARGRRRLAAAIVAVIAGGVLFLVALNRAPAAFAPLDRLPLVERLASALDPERSTTRVRLRLWEGTASALADRPDRLATGFGPETMPLVWAPYYPPILAYDEPRGWVPDRAHNLWLDALLSTGVAGAAALLAFLTALVGAALARLGLVARRGDRRLWLAAWLGGGSAAVMVARLADGGWRLAGPAFGLGLVAGLMLWLAWAAARADEPGGRERTPLDARVPGFALAALAAVVGHVVETQVGFPAVATRVALWLIGGGLVGEAVMAARAEDGPLPAAHGPLDAALAALLVGATLVFDLARPGLVSGGALVASVLIATATLGAALLAAQGGWVDQGRPPAASPSAGIGSWPGPARLAIAVCTALAGYAVLHGALLAALAPVGGAAVPGAAATLLLYAIALGGLLVWSAAREAAEPTWGEPRRSVLAFARPAAAALAIALAVAGPLWIAPTVADALVKEARLAWEDRSEAARERGQSGRAEALLGQALDRYTMAERLAPWEPAYAIARAFALDVHAGLLDERLARALAEAELAVTTSEYDPTLLDGRALALARARDARFLEALGAMARAEARTGPWPTPVLARARALRVWGDLTRDEAQRAQRLAEARAAYARAMALAPRWPEVRDEAALAARLAGDPEAALALAGEAIALDPYYSAAWRTASDAHADRGDHAAAADALARYFADDRNAGDVPAIRAHVRALAAVGRDEDALAAARDVVRLVPGDAHALADLAALLERTGDLAGARDAAGAARAAAPGDAGIAALADRLGAALPARGKLPAPP